MSDARWCLPNKISTCILQPCRVFGFRVAGDCTDFRRRKKRDGYLEAMACLCRRAELYSVFCHTRASRECGIMSVTKTIAQLSVLTIDAIVRAIRLSDGFAEYLFTQFLLLIRKGVWKKYCITPPRVCLPYCCGINVHPYMRCEVGQTNLARVGQTNLATATPYA